MRLRGPAVLLLAVKLSIQLLAERQPPPGIPPYESQDEDLLPQLPANVSQPRVDINQAPRGREVPGSFIVMLKAKPGNPEDLQPILDAHFRAVAEEAKTDLPKLPKFYRLDNLPGYSGVFNAETILAISRDVRRVESIDQDFHYQADWGASRGSNPGEGLPGGPHDRSDSTSKDQESGRLLLKRMQSRQNAPSVIIPPFSSERPLRVTRITDQYNLQMMSQTPGMRIKSNWFKSNPGEYSYVPHAGQGVKVYVVDSGIQLNHTEFQGRAVHFRGRQTSDYLHETETNEDINGHGTHVAGIIGGQWVGVAPWATLVNVKTLDRYGRGTFGSTVRSVNDIIDDHKESKREPSFRGSVINMSFGGIASQGVKKALQSIFSSAIKEDIQCVGAAGNDNAKTESEPCVLYGVHCVGSINANYHKSGTSNYGSHVSIVAPGDGILSAWGGEGTKRGGRNAQVDALIKQSGTSMAAPHVSGLLASFMSGGERKMSWTDVNYSLSGNQIRGHVGGFPQGLRMGFGNNGINNPNRVGQSFTRGEGKIWQSGIISPAARPTPPTYPAGMTLPIYPAGVLSRVGWPWW